MNISVWSMLLILILDLILLNYIFRIGSAVLKAFEWCVNKLSFSMILWDLCLFGRNYFLKLLQWRQNHINKARYKAYYERKIFKYIFVTRFHYIIGFVALIYALVNILISPDPSARFLLMAENTVAGSLFEMLSTVGGQESDNTFGSFLLTALANYLAFWIFIPRYDTKADAKTLSLLPRFVLDIIEVILFSATTLFFSDIIYVGPAAFINYCPLVFKVILSPLILACSLCALLGLLYHLGAIFTLWFKDMVDCIAVLGMLFVFAWIINSFLSGVPGINNPFVAVLFVLLSQRITNWLFHKDEDDKLTPRGYICKRYNKVNIDPPEYYDI